MNLAILTSRPGFATPQHVGGPIVEPETRRRFHQFSDEAFDRNYLTNDGPLSRRLEEEVAARHGVRHAVFMANATLAELVLLKALDLPPGEAVVAADTFISTPHMCEWLGLKPVFCDIDSATLAMTPETCAAKLTDKTRLIIPTHVFGVMSDLPALAALAAERGVKLVADAAHCFDCDRAGVPPGASGVPEYVSFHATKFFSTIEGGAVFTDDDALAEKLRMMRNFGFDRTAQSQFAGTNAKASEINAAFGLASLPALPARLEHLAAIRQVYLRHLSRVPGLRIHDMDAAGRNNYRYFAVFIEDDFGAERDAVHEALRRENVLTRLYFAPGCHRIPHYQRQRKQTTPTSLPATERALDTIICLPTSFVDVDPEDGARRVAELLLAIREQAPAVRDWWRLLVAQQQPKNRL